MPRGPSHAIPSLRLHRPTGQAVVTLTNPRGKRRDYYLGKHGSEQATQAYSELIARWFQGGRELPAPKLRVAGESVRTLAELVDLYTAHAEEYYRRRDGTPTGEGANIARACRLLADRFGRLDPAEVTPTRLREFREGLIEAGDRTRGYVNGLVARVRRMFRWAEGRELVAAGTYHRLQSVEQLQAGRTKAREGKGLGPVSRADVDAVLPFLSRHLAAIVEVLWWTGARCGEIVQLARCHVDMTGKVWLFRPPQHKGSHRNKERVIAIGPEAQRVLRPFVQVVPDRPWFRPCDAVAEQREARRKALRQTTTCGSGRKSGADWQHMARRPPGETYDTRAVAHAIRRACASAGLTPCWSPHRLRHAALSRIRREMGLEAAAAVGGHSGLSVTEIYSTAAREALARSVMAEHG